MKEEKLIRFEKFWNSIFLLSTVIFNLVVTLKIFPYMNEIVILDVMVVIAVTSYLLFAKHILSRIVLWQPVLGKKADYVTSFFLALETSKMIVRYFYYYESFLKNVMLKIAQSASVAFDKVWIIGRIGALITILPFVFVLWMVFIHYCFPKIIKFFKSLTKIEKKYIVGASILMVIVISFVQVQTMAFTFPIPKDEKNPILYDVLYTTDTGVQINSDSFLNLSAPENDFKQPLLGLFSYPFGLIANIGAEIFDILPRTIAYSFFIVCLQGFTLIICTILLSRMMKKQNDILALTMYTVMYATIFFTLNVEQYVFGIFWLIVLIYYFINKKATNPFLFCAAVGSLITNAILLPVLAFQKNWKKFLLKCIKYGLIFLFLVILFGQTYNVLDGVIGFGKYKGAMGMDVSFSNRILQYINFIASCFIAPKGFVDIARFDHVSYQLMPSTTINILGLILLIAMLISFILNYKEKIVQFSFGWLLFSFIILCIIGWGTAENGLIIYAIYFSWAYFILIYMLIDRILKKFLKMRKIVISLIILVMLLINALELWRIIEFGHTYYPFGI